jgi:hypothetical protein
MKKKTGNKLEDTYTFTYTYTHIRTHKHIYFSLFIYFKEQSRRTSARLSYSTDKKPKPTAKKETRYFCLFVIVCFLCLFVGLLVCMFKEKNILLYSTDKKPKSTAKKETRYVCLFAYTYVCFYVSFFMIVCKRQ